jgi:hypothetical protein
MRALLLCIIACGIVVPLGAGSAKQPTTTSVCYVARNAGKLIGKRVHAEGYVLNLGSHGFVLAAKRSDCSSLLALHIDNVSGTEDWQKAFATSLGPRHAILVGTVGWEAAQAMQGRNPSLTVERVVYLSQHEAGANDF